MKSYLQIGILIGVPIFLIWSPASFFDSGQTICPSKLFLDIECLGCGMTRACMHIIHLDFETAWSFNKLSFIVFPICCFYWGKWTYTVGKSFFNQEKEA